MTDAPAVIIAEIPLHKRERVLVSLKQFKGVDLIDVRKWYLDNEDDSLRPSKGIALNVKHLPQLEAAITKALAEARERGLVNTDVSSAEGGTQ